MLTSDVRCRCHFAKRTTTRADVRESVEEAMQHRFAAHPSRHGHTASASPHHRTAFQEPFTQVLVKRIHEQSQAQIQSLARAPPVRVQRSLVWNMLIKFNSRQYMLCIMSLTPTPKANLNGH